MKLPEHNIYIEKSSNFTERKCTIGNLSIVFDILRNKLYSNIIESIAREISCNARDANREVGNGGIPIEIHFPNHFDNNYKICDSGPGISPQRMDDVYANYGNSTKRDSNEFTGAFGLGSKSPLAYTNQFTIRTTSVEENISTTRTYIFYIDETNEGRIPLVSEENLNLPSGTEIIIPVKEEDFQNFIDGTLKSTQYWSIRPLFFGITPLPEYPQTLGSLIAESGTWKIYDKKSNNQFNTGRPESLAIIDGIQYKINESFVDYDERWLLSCNVHMYFGIGELTLSASREALQYDNNTKKLINDRIKLVQKELSEQIIDLLDKKEDYTSAVEFYNFMNLYFHKALNKRNLTWRGNKIIGSEISFASKILENMKAKILSYTKYKKYGKTSVRMNNNTKIIIDKGTAIYYNDIDPSHTYRQKNIKALESNNQIQIISYIKGKTYDDFVADLKAESITYFNSFNSVKLNYSGEVDNSFILDIIKPKLLSSIVEDKAVIGKRIPKPKVPDTFSGYRLVHHNSWKLREHFYPQKLEADVEGCYVDTVFKLDKCTTKYKDGMIWHFSCPEMPEIKKLLGDVQVFSVKEKDIPKFTKLRPLSEVIEEKFKKTITTDYYKSMAMTKILKTYGTSYYSNFSQLEDLKEISALKNKIQDKNSLIIKYFNYIKHFNEIISTAFIVKIEEALNQKNNIDLYVAEAKILLDQMKNRYRLLNFLNSNAKKPDIIDYINLCDEQYNQNPITQSIIMSA